MVLPLIQLANPRVLPLIQLTIVVLEVGGSWFSLIFFDFQWISIDFIWFSLIFNEFCMVFQYFKCESIWIFTMCRPIIRILCGGCPLYKDSLYGEAIRPLYKDFNRTLKDFNRTSIDYNRTSIDFNKNFIDFNRIFIDFDRI